MILTSYKYLAEIDDKSSLKDGFKSLPLLMIGLNSLLLQQ